MQCIKEKAGVEEAINEQFQRKPDSDTNDITEIVWKCFGIGKPLEIVVDEPEPKHFRKNRIVASF